jgi:hypothetical protein
LNKIENELVDIKKGQSNMEIDVKKIRNEMCILTQDKEFIDVNNFY